MSTLFSSFTSTSFFYSVGLTCSLSLLLRLFRRMEFVGLTGGIATGKSTVSRYLMDEYKVALIDFDIIARYVVEPHQKHTLQKIKRAFGDDVLRADGTLDRDRLGQRIFGDRDKARRLNGIMKVPILTKFALDAFKLFVFQGAQIVVLDVPLLYESKLDILCHQTVVVYADQETELKRLMVRDNIDAEMAERKMSSQMPVTKKQELADVVLDNCGDTAQLYQQVDHWWARLVSHSFFLETSRKKTSPLLQFVKRITPTVPIVTICTLLFPFIWAATSLSLRMSR